MSGQGNGHFSKNDWLQRAHEHFKHVAGGYDAGRAFEQGRFWAGELNDRVALNDGDQLLDLGCGTGLFSIPFASMLPCKVVGIDPSTQMIAAGMTKQYGRNVTWAQGNAEHLPFPDASFRAAFLSQVWHHLADQETAAVELFRILANGSGLFIKTFSHDQLRRRWDLKTVFPELMDFMLTIYTDVEEFEALFMKAGFDKVTFTSFTKESTMTPSEMHRVAENRLWSMFSFISEDGLQQGLKYLQNLIAAGNEPVEYNEYHLLVTALKG